MAAARLPYELARLAARLSNAPPLKKAGSVARAGLRDACGSEKLSLQLTALGYPGSALAGKSRRQILPVLLTAAMP